ncbi:hypothetical protein C0Q70_18472 [Pomacea canaliculata]|uniref:Amino acid permease/ SLC12A domain-containing protein n=1 Tax=Pomacea canaliculata TaxID=400727 RepID=A0A2T7NGN5_POMCA|nr:hypothetical protein C0Q70_18472 [Pomacea canaliculata]
MLSVSCRQLSLCTGYGANRVHYERFDGHNHGPSDPSPLTVGGSLHDPVHGQNEEEWRQNAALLHPGTDVEGVCELRVTDNLGFEIAVQHCNDLNNNTAPPSLVWTCGLKPFSTIQWKVEVAAKTEKVHRERQGCELVAPPRGAPRADASSLVAMASLSVALVWVNCTYTKYVTRLQVVFTMAKFIAMVIIIVAGFTTVSQGSSHENIQHLMDDTSTCFGSIALSLFASNFAYAGWQVIAMLIEEMHDPARDVPRAVAYSFLIVILMFVSTSFSYYIVLSPAEVMHSDAVAMTLGQYVHPVLPYMLALTVALCSIGTVNVTIMGQSRILYAAARNGHMPRLLAMLHTKYLMPWPAIITALLGALVMLMSGSVMTMIQYVSLFFSIMMLVLLLALIYLRCVGATSPFTHTTFKMPIVVVVFQVALMLALIVVSVAEKPNELGFCIMLLACTIPIYLVCIRWSNKPQAFVNLMDHLTTFIQKLLQLELSSSFTGQQKV